jgi:CHAT domain-containing protein
VLWPVRDSLAGKRIVLVADEGLNTVPFNVLPWSASPTDQLVLQHAEVTIAPSAFFLDHIGSSNADRGLAARFELIGDPVFRADDWRTECRHTSDNPYRTTDVEPESRWTESLPRLPASRAEVQMVAQLARQSRPGSQIATFLGCDAGAMALHRAASEGVDLLHIATHAHVDAQRPRLSAIALTPQSGGATFGLLDILGLKLNSTLVVLSACDTSRGRLLPGEGVLGPAQAFLQAGAGAVLASYWRIDDRATAIFMQHFYRHLLLDHLPAASALHRAQLDLFAASGFHDWAAFALYGWPDATL